MSAPPPRRRPPVILYVLLGILAGALIVLVVNDDVGRSLGLSNQDFAQFASLVAILVFVGAGVLGRQMGAWTVIRSILAWGVVILGIAGLYASRDELGGFAGRLLGALSPGLPVTGRLTGDANPDSVSVVRASDGHFAVRATVDTVPITLLVDTGASFVTLTYEDAARVGFDTAALDFGTPIRTANGAMTTAAITLDRIAVGPIERLNVKALVAPPGSLGQSLLGMTYLNTLGGYAITGDRLVLTP
ncbi:MAG TPA: TIGR02281 family clan AA aspartic protease [Bauldia sp.]|nr:TIGR02281 family clan AA aspartic protease [Bauldia sp.]